MQTPEETLVNASGSCRDSGWLLVQILRHLGFAARFVSGYLIQLKSDVKSLDGPSGTEVDFTDLHAWCEVYLPGAGWIGLDPTSGLLAGEGHIPLACSPDPGSAAPVTGALDECETEFEHHMKVTRVWEAPRVTLPYTDEQWAEIEALGHQVDDDLRRNDVRLTQGGEPTFVSVDDRDGAEWNTEAMGPTKRLLSADLMDKLRAKYGDGGLLHYGQGKWYPGEQLPRWSLNLFWRKDREPVWTHPELFAERAPGLRRHRRAGAPVPQAAWPSAWGSIRKYVFPAYEDVWYYLWRERKLPTNVDPFDAQLADPLERERLRKVFTQGLDKVVGHVLPVARNPAGTPRWQTGPWFLRSERCYLIPGDSAMGYRLPLDSQPWAKASDLPWVHPPDQTQPFAPLPPYQRLRYPTCSAMRRGGHGSHAAASPTDRAPRCAAMAERSRAALTATAASGAGELAARAAALRVGRLGHAHGDQRRAAPRPAVRLHAADVGARGLPRARRRRRRHRARDEAAGDPRRLRAAEGPAPVDAARHARPGRHRGQHPPGAQLGRAGRADHAPVPGGARDAPVDREVHARRPPHRHRRRQPLRARRRDGRPIRPSCAGPTCWPAWSRYWHNHPALSYLFSGLFIGPTSQAPRIDEARNDSVYEIEIAFAELQRQAALGPQHCPPWLIDRLLRNLLIDVTGNTHRAEFCIDKMYSPDGPTGRLGLLEMRAFEMPPHARMSLTQQLLMRSLVSRFWQHAVPAGAPEALGHRAARPLHAAALRLAGPVRRGRGAERRRLRDQARLVRAAPELPLPAAGRLQRARRRGRAAPRARALARDGRGGRGRRHGALRRFVGRARAGARHRPGRATAMCSPATAASCRCSPPARSASSSARCATGPGTAASSLHPTIGVHAPLTFDLVDTWMSRSMGGCQYHVAHPGGRNYEHLPGQRLRGRGTPPGALLPRRPHAGRDDGAEGRAQPELPVHARPAARCGLIAFPCSENLLAGYAAPAGRYDELLDDDAAAAPALGGVPALARASAPAPSDIGDTLSLMEREIRENGITYNVYADPKGVDRPWEVDPLPLLIVGRRVARDRGRRRAARRAAQPRARRRLRRAVAAEVGRDAGRR